MALLPILTYPDPALAETAVDVETVDDEIRTLLDNMAETMYAAPGVGLAATQIDRRLRVVVMDVPDPRDENASEGEAVTDDGTPLGGLLEMINPRIVEATGDEIAWEEGCLSVPGVFEEVKRPGEVRVEYLDREGRPQAFSAVGLPAVAAQHELDHLDGVLFIERLPPVKRKLVKRKIEKALADGSYPPGAGQPPEA